MKLSRHHLPRIGVIVALAGIALMGVLAGCDTTPAPAPVIVPPAYVPPPVYIPPPPPTLTVSNYWDPSRATGCIDANLAALWAGDVANQTNTWVTVYHGSIDNGTQISQTGLTLYMDDGDVSGATYVTRDYGAAWDAAWNPNHYPPYGKSYDRWIVGSRMPFAIFETYFLPYERPYTGWYPYNLQASEILLTNNTQIAFFNYGIYNWGYSL